ncbi:MAG: hypothetical protein IV100_11415 [Myxococcales bacterium]|nr:hypothetical protein [Myxococcales bacterium]
MDALALDVAGSISRGLVSKFQPCLPEDDERRLVAERLLDVEGATRATWGSPQVV